MRRKTAAVVVLLSVLAAGVACRRGGEGTPPTLPPPGPKTETLRFRLVSAQTGRPVAGARVVVRRGDRAGAGDVLAEAVSDGDGWVTVTYTVRDAWDRPHLEVDAGERFLPRAVWVDDTAAEPAPDVRTLWELRPEIGADRRVTYSLNYGAESPTDRNILDRPCGDIYVYLEDSARPYRANFEEAARRVERALGDRRWYFVESPDDVPAGNVLVRVQIDVVSSPCSVSTAGRVTGRCDGRVIWTSTVSICPPGQYSIAHLMHEFGHVMGLGHLPDDAPCGLMSSRYCGADDFTEFERWAAAPRKYRHEYNIRPDDAVTNPLRTGPARSAFICPSDGGR